MVELNLIQKLQTFGARERRILEADMDDDSNGQSLVAGSSSEHSEHRLICRVCTRNFAQYTCPRCNVRYCSVQCYKGHSVRCTEEFARENVVKEMKDMNASLESKQKMLEALKRIHLDEEGRSVLEDEYLQGFNDDGEDLSSSGVESEEVLSKETLQKIAEGGEVSFEALTELERKEFLRAVAAGKLSHVIKPWEPWWAHPLAHTISLTKSGTRLVQPLEQLTTRETTQSALATEMDSENEAAGSGSPAPPDRPLQAIQVLTPRQPSALLGVHITQAVYGYCFTLRLFNGDWLSDPLDAALVLLSVARVLGDAASPESVGSALAECLETVCSSYFKHAGGFRFGVALFDDAALLLGLNRTGLLCALADMERILESVKKELKDEFVVHKQRYTRPKDSKTGSTLKHLARNLKGGQRGKGSTKEKSSDTKRLQAAEKKVYFMMCWVNEQPSDTFAALAGLVQKEKSFLLESSNNSKLEIIIADNESKVKESRETTPKKSLIQEVT